MNIIGRLAGGLLIFVGLGWLATLAGLPPFNSRSANQLTTQQVTAPMAPAIPVAQSVAGGTPVVGQTSNGQTIVAPAGTVETAPRDATAPTPSPSPVPIATTAASPAPAATTTVVVPPAPAAPVPAGW